MAWHGMAWHGMACGMPAACSPAPLAPHAAPGCSLAAPAPCQPSQRMAETARLLMSCSAYSVGWKVRCGSAGAKCAQCCPVPLAHSRNRPLGVPAAAPLPPLSARYSLSTARMGSLFLRGAAGFAFAAARHATAWCVLQCAGLPGSRQAACRCRPAKHTRLPLGSCRYGLLAVR